MVNQSTADTEQQAESACRLYWQDLLFNVEDGPIGLQGLLYLSKRLFPHATARFKVL
jgi:hypothetical protein